MKLYEVFFRAAFDGTKSSIGCATPSFTSRLNSIPQKVFDFMWSRLPHFFITWRFSAIFATARLLCVVRGDRSEQDNLKQLCGQRYTFELPFSLDQNILRHDHFQPESIQIIDTHMSLLNVVMPLWSLPAQRSPISSVLSRFQFTAINRFRANRHQRETNCSQRIKRRFEVAVERQILQVSHRFSFSINLTARRVWDAIASQVSNQIQIIFQLQFRLSQMRALSFYQQQQRLRKITHDERPTTAA